MTYVDGDNLPAQLKARDARIVELEKELSLLRQNAMVSQCEAHAEKSLRESEADLARAQRMAHLGNWKWDLAKDTVRWSEELFHIFGVDPGTFTPSNAAAQAIIHPADRGLHAELVAKALKGEVVRPFECRLVRPTGEERYVLASGFDVELDAQGHPVRLFGSVLDITERKQAEQALRQSRDRLQRRTWQLQETVRSLRAEIQARRRLEQEVVIVSDRERRRLGQDLHDDLGQQLVGLGYFAGGIKAKLAAEAHPVASAIDELHGHCQLALEVARNLARSYCPVELERCGLKDSIVRLAGRTEALSGVCCAVRFKKGFLAQKETHLHLYRIVQEAIGNALKHGRARRIDVEAKRSQGQMILAVSDDGVGFTPTKSASGGMGLNTMHYRARIIGAELKVERIGSSGGCRVSCTWNPKLA